MTVLQEFVRGRRAPTRLTPEAAKRKRDAYFGNPAEDEWRTLNRFGFYGRFGNTCGWWATLPTPSGWLSISENDHRRTNPMVHLGGEYRADVKSVAGVLRLAVEAFDTSDVKEPWLSLPESWKNMILARVEIYWECLEAMGDSED